MKESGPETDIWEGSGLAIVYKTPREGPMETVRKRVAQEELVMG